MFYSFVNAEHGRSRSWTVMNLETEEGPGLRVSTYSRQCEGSRSFTQPPNSYTKSCKPLALVFLEKPQNLNWLTQAHHGAFFSFNSHGTILLVRGHLCLRTSASLSVTFFVPVFFFPVQPQFLWHIKPLFTTRQGCPTCRMPFSRTAK